MTASERKKWNKSFDAMVHFTDLKKLKELCMTDEQFLKLKHDIIDASNARRRDVLNVSETKHVKKYSNKGHYTSDDYIKSERRPFDEGDLDLYSYLKLRQNRQKRLTEAFRKGDTVILNEEGHYYHGQRGIIIETRGRTSVLINILTKSPPKTVKFLQQPNDKALMWTDTSSLTKVKG